MILKISWLEALLMDKQIKIGGTTYIVRRKFVGKKPLKQLIERLILQRK